MKACQFFELLMAFQAFAGKPMRAIDAAAAMSDAELESMRSALSKMAIRLESDSRQAKMPELAKLADAITVRLSNAARYAQEARS